jgi:hypothetical protein
MRTRRHLLRERKLRRRTPQLPRLTVRQPSLGARGANSPERTRWQMLWNGDIRDTSCGAWRSTAASRVGLVLEEIADLLDTLAADRSPNRPDWTRFSSLWR